ncbi:metallophosphoesterase [Psychromarinibacter sp. C21-152]|uniref:Metallophosphoesterase n=1 Tax=Psychromarinibacter sediminicola TaxID=3033385 RepID=A0AAE3NW41_9RHOB|nr:metallophosphoesterase [Psychromarinibacter sediminicola]MDF0603319.1 metallophosphoesterase [Psychromarinibacter sediminicola]
MDDVTTLGDPHLGRKFKTGVPLHRVGEREEMQWRDFCESLTEVDTQFHVNMGDLFDTRIVSPEIVLAAANAYIQAAELNPATTYVVLIGNHDMSRDADRASSFDLFEALVSRISNIIVVRDRPRVLNRYGFVPYSLFQPTEELVAELPDQLDAVFGHWDIVDHGGHNVIPTKLLAAKNITTAVSGHDHLPRQEKRHGVDITVTGSMQPYTHAEDDTGWLYVTTTLDELEKFDTTNLNVRVLLKEGETLPENVDCLSLTAKRVTDEDEDGVEIDTSEFESLDLRSLLGGALEGLSCKDRLLEEFSNA